VDADVHLLAGLELELTGGEVAGLGLGVIARLLRRRANAAAVRRKKTTKTGIRFMACLTTRPL
jgi:hypothetical protein